MEQLEVSFTIEYETNEMNEVAREQILCDGITLRYLYSIWTVSKHIQKYPANLRPEQKMLTPC